MCQWSEDQLAQIKAALAENRDGRGWASRLSARHKDIDELAFKDLFSITVEDLAQYVEAYGWDPRTVREVSSRPPDADAKASFYLYPRGTSWVRASLGDRGDWIEQDFPTLQEARRDTARVLLHIQWSAWNGENKRHRGLVGRLMDLYPPPPT